LKTRGEIRPADVAPVLAPDRNGAVSVFPMKWGYSGRSLLINARVETAAVRPSFREDRVRHRCIAPASWYFEWEDVTEEWIRPGTDPEALLGSALTDMKFEKR
jgi:putative SOS response-associated peptidase YedK